VALCDPTLPDDEDEEGNHEEEYDKTDVMDIDMCEKSALCEAEHEAGHGVVAAVPNLASAANQSAADAAHIKRAAGLEVEEK